MTLRLGIVGCGAIVDELHVPAARRVREVGITAFVDSDLNRARQFAASTPDAIAAPTIRDIRDRVDALLIATPPHVRVKLVQEAFDLGLDVLVEKPLANTVAECHQMVDAAQASGRLLAGAHVYRFWPSRERLRHGLQSGEFGQVRNVVMSQGAAYGWQSVTGYTVRKELVPGGVLINAGIHPLDTLICWLGEAEGFTYLDDSLGGLESNCDLRLRYASGAEARLRMSRTGKLRHEIRIETDQCTIDLGTYDRLQFTVYRKGTSEVIRTGDADDDHLSPAADQLRNFAASIRERRPPRVTGAEATKVIAQIEACYRDKKSRPLPSRVPIPGAMW